MFGYYRGMLLQFELGYMHQYLDLVQEALSKEQADFEAHVNDLIKGLPIDDQDAVTEMHTDEYWILKRVLPTHLYTGFIVSWYSFVESQLFVLCDHLYKDRPLRQSHREWRGRHRGTQKVRMYLTTNAAVSLVQEDWDELRLVNQIRNQIVHAGDVFDATPTGALLQYLEAHQLVTDLAHGDRQKLSPNLEYCQHLITFGQSLFTNLYFDAALTADRTGFTAKKRDL